MIEPIEMRPCRVCEEGEVPEDLQKPEVCFTHLITQFPQAVSFMWGQEPAKRSEVSEVGQEQELEPAA